MRRQAAADVAEEEEEESNRSRAERSGHRRVAPVGVAVVEKTLPNGDLYRGEFAGRAPHGYGKYLWADGCMYEGDWRRGKAAGKGKFSWPTGASYEGEFRSGRMEGFGVFTGTDGDTYRGHWSADRKHGHGAKSYANGDFYDGAWRRNLQDGHGRYVWRNGNMYVGEWRAGVISGRGVLIYANGNRYDGHWDGGVPRGSGVFTWPDGSCYVGSWNKERQLTGTFYPPASVAKDGVFPPPLDDGLPLPLTLPDHASDDDRGGADKNFPRICIWESEGEAGDITCDIVDTLDVYKDSSSSSASFDQPEDPTQRRRSPCCFSSCDAKKPGQTISKGHKNYDLMLNLQLGIRYSVGRPAAMPLRELQSGDFDPREKFWTKFPTEGSKLTPPHQSAEFKWKDYCPIVFRHLRKLFAVDPADYMLAICGSDALRELSSPGKSGSFFYMTQDDRFMIKTVKKSEVKVLIRMLPSYYKHVSRYKNSLVTKFFGVHCVKPVGGQKVRFIVMGNLFCSEYRIHKRFDLKGSSHGRTTDKAEGEIDETTTLKDLDLNFVFRLRKSWFRELIEQIGRDCEFLEAERIMDYSLLVGLHFRDDVSAAKMGLTHSDPPSNLDGKRVPFQDGADNLEFPESESGWQDLDRIMEGRKPMIRLGANMPAKVVHLRRTSELELWLPTSTLSAETSDGILYFGIIDILQDYDISKKLEHAYKSLQADPTSISAVDPKLYSRRFRDFISRVFVPDDDQKEEHTRSRLVRRVKSQDDDQKVEHTHLKSVRKAKSQ